MSQPVPSAARPRARSIVIGLVLAAFIGFAVPYNELLVKGTQLALSSCTPLAFLLLFVWVVAANPALRLLRPSWALTRGELLVVLAMMMVATAVPTRGVTGMLLSMISGPHYYASPENQWPYLLLPHVPRWSTVEGAAGLRQFYEGTPPGVRPEWEIWLVPLFWWLLFFVALWVATLCLMSLLRRQWVERERLAFPVLQMPLAMVEGAEGRLLPPFFRNRLMWGGFALSFALVSMEALHFYFPTFPVLVEQYPVLETLRGTVKIPVRLNLMMLGFAYLVDRRLSFSLWFFYLVHAFLYGACSLVGVSCTEQLGYWTLSGPVGPIFAHQSMGAMIVFVAFGLWAAREHLRDVLRGAWRPERDAGAAHEMVSHRRALLGILGGGVVMTAWLTRLGTPLWIAPIVVGVAFVIFVSLTRAMVDGGLAVIVPAMIPLGFVLSGLGTEALGVSGVVAMAFSMVWAGDLLMIMMPPCAHAARVASDLPAGRNRVFVGALLAMICSFVVSVVVTLALAYEHGAANLHPQYFRTFPQYPGNVVATKLSNPSEPSLAGWGWTGAGAVVMTGLTLASYRFPWWPLHPLGYMVSPVWVMRSLWFPFFVAWLIKSLVMKFGGIEGYRRSRWLFYGVILGQIVAAGFWLVVDILTGTTENQLSVY
jgi:hypothetical protein